MPGVGEDIYIGPAKTTAVRWLLFFALFFLVIWLWIDPNVIYYAHGWSLQYTIYVPGTPVTEDSPYAPGAVSQWAAGYLSYYYFYAAYGAAIVTGVVWLVCLGADRYIVAVGGGRWLRWLAFVPALAVFAQYGQYSHFLGTNLALAIVMLFLYAYTRLPSKRWVLSLVVFVGLTVATYLAAVDAFLVFAILGMAFELVVRRRWVVGAVGLLVLAATPLAASAVLTNLAPAKAYAVLLPVVTATKDPTANLPALSLLLIVPLCGLGWLVRHMLRRRLRPAPSNGVDSDSQPRQAMDARWSVATLALLVAFVAGVWLTSNTAVRRCARFNRFVRRHMWDDAVAEARKIPKRYFTPLISFDVNRALYYKGELADEMFSFPQTPTGVTLEMGDRGFVFTAYRRSELLLEIGHVNAAEHLTHEVLECMNYNPWALGRLAMINMVKGLPDAASVFLATLAKDSIPGQGSWAREYQAKIQADPDLSSDPAVQQLRAMMPVDDSGYTAGRATPLKLLVTQALVTNPQNGMAFEYVMATRLALGEPGAAIRGVRYLDGFGYPAGRIPRHYEEAILLHVGMTGNTPDLGDRRVSDSAQARFGRFRLLLAKSSSAERAGEALKGEFGDTYYYYVAFTLRAYDEMVSKLK